jgi:hypothetical protein
MKKRFLLLTLFFSALLTGALQLGGVWSRHHDKHMLTLTGAASVAAYQLRLDATRANINAKADTHTDRTATEALITLRSHLLSTQPLDLPQLTYALDHYVQSYHRASYSARSILPSELPAAALHYRLTHLSPSILYRSAELAEIQRQADRLATQIDTTLTTLRLTQATTTR